MKKCRYWNCFIILNTYINVSGVEFPYLDGFFPVSLDSSFSWVARNKREVFAPCHTTEQLHREPFGTDGKDDCDSTRAEFFKTGTHSPVQDC